MAGFGCAHCSESVCNVWRVLVPRFNRTDAFRNEIISPVVVKLAGELVSVLSTGKKFQRPFSSCFQDEVGKLTEVDIKDMTTTMSFPTGTGNLALPLHMGINYQFQISTDKNIVYFGSCWSRGKRNYGSDWVVKDPVEFRIQKGKLFLKRPTKGELRLALMGRFRVISTKDESGADHQSFEPLPPFATKQIEPECH